MFDSAPDSCAVNRRLPLCARYLVVYGRSVSWRTSTRGSVDDSQVLWAIGALADGETEILGTWSRLDEGRPSWTVAAAELRRRGVERIRFLITDDADALTADLPGKPAIVSLSAGTPGSLSSLGLAAAHRRIVERTTLLADAINATIVRRLRRMEPLVNQAVALQLVARSLAQAKRRIEASSDTSSDARYRPSGLGAPWAITGQRRVMPIAARGPAR